MSAPSQSPFAQASASLTSSSSSPYIAYGEELWPPRPSQSPIAPAPGTASSSLLFRAGVPPLADDGCPPSTSRTPDAGRALTTRPIRTPHHPTLPHPPKPRSSVPPSLSGAHPVNTQAIKPSQDVLFVPLNPASRATVPYTPHHGAPQHVLGSLNLSSHPSSPRHATISPRQRTSPTNNLNDLASQHGLPQFLPPAPRTNSIPQQPPIQPINIQQPQAPVDPSSEPPFDLNNLCSNYLSMLQNTATNTAEVTPAIEVAGIPIEEETMEQANAIQALMDSLAASTSNDFLTAPSLTSSPQFLTSPLESPWDDFLQTPAMGTEGDFTPDIYTSPAMFDSNDMNDMMFEGASLFGDMAAYETSLLGTYPAPKPPAVATLPMGNLYTLSPHTPALDSLNTSPALVDESSFAVPGQPARRKTQPTGTRKNVMPESLIPLDAPIQSRKYVTPSATSRKEVPATFARKRSRSSAFGEEDGDVAAAAGPLDETEEEAIKSKRLQNTLAARRSRKRKLEHQRGLEDEIARLNAVADAWRQHALDCRAALEAAGIAPPAIAADLASLG